MKKLELKQIYPEDTKITLDEVRKYSSWFNKSWSGYAGLLAPTAQEAVYGLNKYLPGSMPLGVQYNVETTMNYWFYPEEGMKHTRDVVLNKIRENPHFVRERIEKWQPDWQKFQEKVIQLKDEKLSDISDEELWQIYLEFLIFYSPVPSQIFLTDSFMQTGTTDWVAELFKNEAMQIPKGKIPEILEKSTRPTLPTFTAQEEMDLLDIALSPSSNERLKLHVQKYYWIHNSYFQTVPLTLSYFEKKLAEMLKDHRDPTKFLEKKKKIYEENLRLREELAKEYELTPFLKGVINALDLGAWWQDKRKQSHFQANYILWRIFEEIANRKKIDKEIVFSLYPYEMEALLFNRPLTPEALVFPRTSLALYTPQGTKVFNKKEIDEAGLKPDYFFGEEKELKGLTACIGIVEGLIEKVNTPIEIEAFRQGHILVSNETTPDFVPAMKKAKAILTERGGLTCHAAIISRELNTPCVVGIKNVTRNLKDGDLVEVDANKGVIKILKRKE